MHTETTDAPSLNRRQKAKALTADKVLKAARAVFLSDGFKDGTIRDIAKAAGMSTGAVFANYKDKAVLYVAAMGHPPITPEQGREAMQLLRALALACEIDGVGPRGGLSAVGVLADRAEGVLYKAKFPAMAVQVDESAFSPAMMAEALDVWAPGVGQ